MQKKKKKRSSAIFIKGSIYVILANLMSQTPQ